MCHLEMTWMVQNMNCGFYGHIMPLCIRVLGKSHVIFYGLGNSTQVSLDSHRGPRCVEEWAPRFWSGRSYEVGDETLALEYRNFSAKQEL